MNQQKHSLPIYHTKKGDFMHSRTYTSKITEIDIKLTAHTQKNSPQARMKVFSYSTASISLAGLQHLHKLRFARNSLIPCCNMSQTSMCDQ